MRTKTKIKTFIFSLIAFIVGVVGGFGSYVLAFSPESDKLFSLASGDLSVHFLELGNKHTGDCIYIKANDKDILIDAGSAATSSTTIINYVNQYCEDEKLEYLIATHAHNDHIAAFPSTDSRPGIFDSYQVETIIDFGEASQFGIGGNNNPSEVYLNYVTARNKEVSEENATHIAVSDWGLDINNPAITTVFDLGEGITMKILYQKFYTTPATNNNDYSVCLLLTQGDTNILLTGDLEEKGEQSLVENNPDLPECDLFKAGHHGSKTSSNDILLNKIKPKNVVFTCVAGSDEYTNNFENVFPTKLALERIAKHTSNCYITTVCTNEKEELEQSGKQYSKFESMNGDIIFVSNKNGYSINCTNNNTLLKDTDWCKQYRPDIQWVA